jgi:hypothetical protein
MALIVAILAAPATAQKIYIDYDRSVDFSQYQTFAWFESDATSMTDTSPLMHERVKSTLIAALKGGGLQMVGSDPDLYVTYHTQEKEEMQLNTTSFGYGYGGGWAWDPYWDWGPSMGSSTTTSYTYTRGTLIVDVWDAERRQLVWRGAAEAVVKEKPENAARQIEKAVDKMGKKWDKMYKGN